MVSIIYFIQQLTSDIWKQKHFIRIILTEVYLSVRILLYFSNLKCTYPQELYHAVKIAII